MDELDRERLAEWTGYAGPRDELEAELKPLFDPADWDEFIAHLDKAFRFGFAAGWNELARRLDRASGGDLQTERLDDAWRRFDPDSERP